MRKSKKIRSKSFGKIFYFIFPIILGTIFTLISCYSVLYKSNTRDESRHLVRGTMLLETGDYRLNKHHPIFGNILNAIPNLFNEKVVTPSTNTNTWARADKDTLASKFVEINDGKRAFVLNILNPARLSTIVFMAITGILLYFLIKDEFGVGTSIIFSILYFFSPNLIANSRLVTTDAYVVPIVFSATFFLYKFLKYEEKKFFIWFIILSLFALITKYSAVPLAFFWLGLLFIFEYQKLIGKKLNIFKKLIRSMPKVLISIGAWILGLTAAYGFRFETLASTDHSRLFFIQNHLWNLADITLHIEPLTRFAQFVFLYVPLPFPEYIQGFLENVVYHDIYGHDTFLMGEISRRGWWYYFPLCMLFKMPIPVLIGILGLFGIAGTKIYKSISFIIKKGVKRSRKALSKFRLEPHHTLIAIPVLFFLLSMQSGINLGIRHILVVFPFIYLGIALLIQRLTKWSKYIYIPVILLCGWYLYSTISIYPHYLEYFNEIVGGPENGYKYLLDSNLSWAQDDFYVEDYINDLPDDKPVYRNPNKIIEEPGIVVIDLDRVMGRFWKYREASTWIYDKWQAGEIEPIDRINYTYIVFDIKEEDLPDTSDENITEETN